MFTKVTLTNFRTFDHIEFDLTRKKGESKHFIMIYGENGIGKSNLMSAFVLLQELSHSMNLRDHYEKLLSQDSIFADEKYNIAYRNRITNEIRDMKSIIQDYRLIDCNANIQVEYEFILDGKNGKYTIEFGPEEIVHERLEFLLNQRRSVFYDCIPGKIKINNSAIYDKAFLADIQLTAKKYWGKHSLISIINYEITDKSSHFSDNSLNDNFVDIILFLSDLSCHVSLGDKMWNSISAPLEILEKPIYGKIDKAHENQLDFAEEAITAYLHETNPAIESAKYEKNYSDQKVMYQLYIRKMVAGTYRSIPFDRESSGNHQLLQFFCLMLSACLGNCIYADELDSGIHELLFAKLLEIIQPLVTGQVVLTTHNTRLLEMEQALVKDATYILFEDEKGTKFIQSINNSKKRTYANNNIRSKYFHGDYNGIPSTISSSLKNCIEESLKKINALEA